MFTQIQTKSKDLLKIRNGWFFNDSSKIVKQFSQMQNLGQLGPENCRAYVFFAWFFCLFVFVFVMVFFCLFVCFVCFFLVTHCLILICTYIPYCTISVSKIQNFQLLRGHIPLRHPLCVQACNWRWRSTKSSPNVEDGCTALCSFGVLAFVKCCKQCFIAMVFFSFLIHKFPAILS